MTRFQSGLILVLGVLALAGCIGRKAPQVATPAPEDKTGEVERWLLDGRGGTGWFNYALAWSDLNADGSPEAVIYLAGPSMCGTGGCPTVVLTKVGTEWLKVGEVSVSRTPVTMLDSETNGWRDLTVDFAGGGGPSGIAQLKFDGRQYPENATVPPAVPVSTRGTELIARDPQFKRLGG